jgi:hypothetical protein
MKRKLKFYKYWYAPLNFKDYSTFEYSKWIPKFEFSKNVQGWSFTRNYSIYWIRWAITYTTIIHSDFNIDRKIAHEINVKKYIKNEKEM